LIKKSYFNQIKQSKNNTNVHTLGSLSSHFLFKLSTGLSSGAIPNEDVIVKLYIHFISFILKDKEVTLTPITVSTLMKIFLIDHQCMFSTLYTQFFLTKLREV